MGLLVTDEKGEISSCNSQTSNRNDRPKHKTCSSTHGTGTSIAHFVIWQQEHTGFTWHQGGIRLKFFVYFSNNVSYNRSWQDLKCVFYTLNMLLPKFLYLFVWNFFTIWILTISFRTECSERKRFCLRPRLTRG